MATEFKRVPEIANEAKILCDSYLNLSITHEGFIEKIGEIVSSDNNRSLILKRNKFSATFEKTLGKERLLRFKEALLIIDKEKYAPLQ